MQGKTKIYYYISPSGENPVKDFLWRIITKIQRVKIYRVFEYIEKYGLKVPLPHVKKLKGTLFWEIRIVGKDNIRVLYATIHKHDVLVLHGFIKKTQRTPRRELRTALLRYKDWKSRSRK